MKKPNQIKTKLLKQGVTEPNTSLHNKTGPWRTEKPETDYKTCVSCGLCSKICPEGCIVMAPADGYLKDKPKTDYDYCKGCALCVRECPVKAIKMVNDY
jgi:pyruvate ferredoxin oxidoreductase delta subunit